MELFILIIALILNGAYFSMLSSMFSSMTKEEINKITEKKTKFAGFLQNINYHYEESLNAFFVGEIVMYIVATLLTGALVIELFHNWMYILYTFPLLIVFTVFLRSLFYSLGKRFGHRLTIPLSPLFYTFIVLVRPLMYLLRFLNNTIGGQVNEDVAREELTALVENAHEDGTIDTDEYRILKNIIHFSDVYVSDVMTPRTVVFSCEADQTVGEVVNLPEIRMYSRIPLREGESLDDGVAGYAMSKDILHAALTGKSSVKLRDIAREAYFIPENAELDTALDSFLQRRQHLFLVVDEYGGIEGLITMEDVVETILGAEIVDEADRFVDLRELAKQRRDKRIAMLHSRNQ
jgi:CBS domain containing-hemolysin-like protein